MSRRGCGRPWEQVANSSSTIPGASQLFWLLLTCGDNPLKAVNEHEVRGEGRQQGGFWASKRGPNAKQRLPAFDLVSWCLAARGGVRPTADTAALLFPTRG